MASFGIYENEVTYLSGVDATNHIAAHSFHTWVSGTTYAAASDARKWGDPTPGTGATISYGFDTASHWTSGEQGAFMSAMHLWQAVANVTFLPAASASSAEYVFVRATDHNARTHNSGYGTYVGQTEMGTPNHATLNLDTSTTGFGPLGLSFTYVGGYPWMTVEHEIGHALGLGHAGPYDGDANSWSGDSNDSLTKTIMSYWAPRDTGENVNWGVYGGYDGVPVTPQMLDILAMQRIYGMPVNSPLAGGVTFGFHTTLTGDIAQFFDFTINQKPIVTLWSGGTGNTLDLSGYATSSIADLHDGTTSSVANLSGNLTIAIGTQINTLILGSGNDIGQGNDNNDVLIGGAGADTLAGGTGNDHLYGGGTSQTPGDGGDVINAGNGSDYVQGNAGSDTLSGGAGSDRIYGGADGDLINGEAGNDVVNGNLGNDNIDGGDGNDVLRGGQGDDTIQGGWGVDTLMGDLGNDRLIGGPGLDTFYGGDGADTFVFTGRDAVYVTQYADAYTLNRIADFQDGIDHIHLDMGLPAAVLQLGVQASVQAAADTAGAWVANTPNQIAVATVGSEALVFFSVPGVGMEGIDISGLQIANLGVADFV